MRYMNESGKPFRRTTSLTRAGRMTAAQARRRDAEDALTVWRDVVAGAAVKRDPLVREASAAGVGKKRIHDLTGIARSTIDRILTQDYPAGDPKPSLRTAGDDDV